MKIIHHFQCNCNHNFLSQSENQMSEIFSFEFFHFFCRRFKCDECSCVTRSCRTCAHCCHPLRCRLHRFSDNISEAFAKVREHFIFVNFNFLNFQPKKKHRSSAEKLKNAKTMDINGKLDCQLQSMSQVTIRGENGSLSTPLVVDGNLMRQSPQLMMLGNACDAIDADDTDPDVIPNQYGKCAL